jgi:hypothetical protein
VVVSAVASSAPASRATPSGPRPAAADLAWWVERPNANSAAATISPAAIAAARPRCRRRRDR